MCCALVRGLACYYESFIIHPHCASSEPVGVGDSADKHEYVTYLMSFLLASGAFAPTDRLQALARRPDQSGEVGLEMDLYVWQGVDAVNEILRHPFGQTASTDQQVHVGNAAREVHDTLAGRVATAHDNYVASRAQLRLNGRCPVIHAATLEAAQVGQVELP